MKTLLLTIALLFTFNATAAGVQLETVKVRVSTVVYEHMTTCEEVVQDYKNYDLLIGTANATPTSITLVVKSGEEDVQEFVTCTMLEETFTDKISKAYAEVGQAINDTLVNGLAELNEILK